MENENQPPRPENDEAVRQHVRQRRDYLISLASTFRTELTGDMPTIYLTSLLDVTERLLRKAVSQGLKKWKFFPSVSEIWEEIDAVQCDPAGHERGYERLKQRLATQKEVLALKSALDEVPLVKGDITQMKAEDLDLANMSPEQKKHWAHAQAVKQGWL